MSTPASPFGAISTVVTSLYVRDLDAALAWYRDVLGIEALAVGEEEHRWAALQAGPSVLLLESLDTLPAAMEPTAPGSESTTVNLIVDRDAAEVRDELLARGVVCGPLVPSPHHLNFLMRDPDGNRFYVAQPVAQEAPDA